jgi:hypothetical protein
MRVTVVTFLPVRKHFPAVAAGFRMNHGMPPDPPPTVSTGMLDPVRSPSRGL